MSRVTLLLLIVAACGGAQIPQHNGYKGGEKAKPWKKAKTLKWDDKGEAKADGDLSYAEMRRAAWYVANLPQNGELDLRLEITPGDFVSDDFDLAMEVLDPGNRVIAKEDAEEGQAGNLTKQKSVLDLPPGKYLIHLYLQSRLDSADYTLKASFKPSAASEGNSNFPAEVAFLPPLPMVPISDDTPKNYRPETPAVVIHTHHRPRPTPKKPEAPTAATLSARIIGVSVVSGGTQITIGRGTATGAKAGMPGKVNGLSSGSFTIGSCNERACTATVSATPDQVNHAAGSVTLTLTP
jgi:hypothetical protein